MNKLAVAFTGPSNSGKTTLIVKVASLLAKNYKLAIIKHDPKDKGVFDTAGKDSDQFTKTGAQVCVSSPKRTTLFSNVPREVKDIIPLFGDFDILLVEGLKHIQLPRIGIFRDKIDIEYLEVCNAIAIDKSINAKDYDLKSLDILDLNDENMIVNWILKNGQKI